MLRRISWAWWLLVAVLGLRLVSMVLLPLADTTEARYAEIARLMSVSGDWITPWFSPGVPFWGKPPLSFWCQALSYNLFGVSEFSARLPSWLVTLATLLPIFALARAYYGPRAARRALLIFSTCALAYVLSGAVLTDPFLTLGTTWSMTAFFLARAQPRLVWRYGFFVGLAIGLLAKGPVALVLVGGAIVPWLCWHHRSARAHLRALPWGRGSLLAAMLVLPWYIAADIKTPGFLYYFIVGEHVLRFLDPSWAGDLYGTAHQRTHGTIWWYWIVTSAPWGVLGLVLFVTRICRREGMYRLRLALIEPIVTYLLAWSMFSLVFFTFSANILWTYVLPALPAFSILLSGCLDHSRASPRWRWRTPLWATAITPLLGVAVTLIVLLHPQRLDTAKSLIQYVEQHAISGDKLVYVGSRPFSARFYSRETAGLVSLQQLPSVATEAPARLYLAIPKNMLHEVNTAMERTLKPQFQSGRYILVTPADQPVAPVIASPNMATEGANNG